MSARTQSLVSGLLVPTVPLVVLAAAAGVVPVPLVALAAAAVGAVLAVLALRRPSVALLVGTAVVVLVPYYDGRYVTRAIGLTPMGATCLVLLPAAWTVRSRVRWGPVDTAFGVLVLLRALSLLVNFSHGPGAVFTLLLQVALPYVVFRALTAAPDAARRLAGVVVGTAAVLAVVGIREHAGVPNPFFTLLPPQYQAEQWARPELRTGAVRAEASFGHPIAFGMFLAAALVLAVALALTVRSLAARLLLLATSGLLLLALTGTLSRGPLLVAAVGTTWWVLASVRRLDVLRLGLVAAVAVGVVVSTPVLATVENLVSSSSGDTREAASAQYRLEILAVARQPEQFSLLGRPNEDGGVTQAVFERTGLKSIDSEYALVYLTAGLLALVAFVALVVLVVRVALLADLPPVERAWAVAMAASSLNLLTVALLTQHAELFWAWTALVAGIAQRHARRPVGAREQVAA